MINLCAGGVAYGFGGEAVADFRRFHVWVRAHHLAAKLQEITATYPQSELFDLTRQTRRAARSIPANIAEGLGKFGTRERARFVNIALGSAHELENHLEFAFQLSYIDEETHKDCVAETQEVKRMLVSLYRRLRNN